MIEEKEVIVGTRKLHRLVITPDSEIRGGLIFFHGQGDFIDRYPEILRPFSEAGIMLVLTDMPGHGRSPGRRGVVPGFELIDQLAENARTEFPEHLEKDGIGLAGHSAGGMIALREYLLHPERYRFAWFSSPLLDPSHNLPASMRRALLFLAKFFPWMRRSTGVSSADCRDDGEQAPPDETALYHNQINLGWASSLVKAGERIKAGFPNLSLDRPVLFTQGTADSICPISILQERLKKLPQSHQLVVHEIEEGLHEPFVGTHADHYQKLLRKWVSELEI